MPKPLQPLPDTPLGRFLAPFQADRGENITALAGTIRMTASAFGRALKLSRMKVDNCLKLADVLGVDPRDVLRAAGQDDTARLLDRLCGQKDVRPLSDVDRRLLELRANEKKALLATVDTVRREHLSTGQGPPASGARATKRRSAG